MTRPKLTREELVAQHPEWGRPNGRYFDRDGQPMALADWLERFDDREYKRVARTELPGGGFVSTVWLGLDHGYGGRRLIFETMVFETGDEERDGDQDRYSTLEEAKAGHAAMVVKHGGGN